MLNSDPAEPKSEYAFWLEPETELRVEYSLALFHEIDFQVNEGYRRIPHGGIEIGGVLWGRQSPKSIVIEAFRQIACEHASGPSFNLSETDLKELATLLASGKDSDELRELEPIGWFIAHTRGPLKLTDRERELFDRYFPGPARVTLLVKPERFQPTRFGFLVRRLDGSVPVDAADAAVILPLPGRAGKGVLASIPAPARKQEVVPKVSPAAPQPKPIDRPERELTPEVESKPEPAPSRPERSREVIVMKPASSLNPPPIPMAPAHAAPQSAAPPPAPISPSPSPLAVMPPPANLEPLPKRNEQFRGVQEPIAPHYDSVSPGKRSPAWRLALLLLLSALLGSALGYYAYLQLPSPVIELHAERRGSQLFVQWPASQTRDVDYAAFRINDGPAQLLSLAQKLAGELEVPISGQETKVEVTAQHWFRDAHGFIRYLSAPRSTASDQEPAKAPASLQPARADSNAADQPTSNQ